MDRSGYEKTAHLYDLFDRKPNIPFFRRCAAKSREILDIGAGTGRIAIPLAIHGVKVFCVEPSPAMRREFERKIAEQPVLSINIQLIPGTASSFDLGSTFPAAFLSGTYDHFLDDDERLSSLVNIARHLDCKGVLVFDVFFGLMRDAPLSPAGKVSVGTYEYQRYVGAKLLPDDRMETQLVFEIYQGGERIERIEERSLVGVSSRAGIHQVLSAAGFSVAHEWGDHDFTPYREGDNLLIVEAVKED